MTWSQLVPLVLAAFAAGGVNAIAGGGTVLSFPVLVWIGLDPVVANATNQVALWPGVAAGAYGHRQDLTGEGRLIATLSLPLVIGGTAGAMLLLRTPSALFATIAPFLILTSTVLLSAAESTRKWTSRRTQGERSFTWWSAAVLSHLAIAVYAGYFGGGLGILLLTALGILGLTDFHQMNGIKNASTLLAQGASVVYLVWRGKIVWPAALIMAMAAVTGALMSTRLAHRVGRRAVRKVVIVVGIGVAIVLLLRQLG